MTFQDAEKAYKDLRSQHAAGKMTDADFEAQVNQLKVQDAQGRWWQLGVRTGEWYYNDGQKWVKGKPPTATVPPPAPAAPPEEPATAPVPVPVPTPAPSVTPPPAVAATTMPLSTAVPAANEEKAERASVTPRAVFAAKPEGKNGGGMSRPVLIGIIAVVVVVVIALLVGAFFVVSPMLTARATATVTQVAVLPVTPTIAAPPTPAVTDTPLLSPTLVVTTTNTPEKPPTSTRAAAPARTATPAKSPTSGKPATTATPVVPPGLYVTKIELDRSIEANVKFGFRVTFFNNTGGPVHYDNWLVLIYRDSDYVEGKTQKPTGQTRKVILDVPTGTSDVLIPDAYSVGTGGMPSCTYQAEADYIGDNTNPVPFTTINGKIYRFAFTFCQ